MGQRQCSSRSLLSLYNSSLWLMLAFLMGAEVVWRLLRGLLSSSIVVAMARSPLLQT